MKENNDNIDSLTELVRLVESRNCRLEKLREAALPLAKLLAGVTQPENTKYILRYEYRCCRNWLIVWKAGERDQCWHPVEWTLEREVGRLAIQNVDGQIPRGPSRQELREFCEWLVAPETWENYCEAERAVSDKETALTQKTGEVAMKMQFARENKLALLEKTIDQFRRMIAWVEKEISEKEDPPDPHWMKKYLGESWLADDCPLCKAVSHRCDECIVAREYMPCSSENGRFARMADAETWYDWVSNARRFVDLLIAIKVKLEIELEKGREVVEQE